MEPVASDARMTRGMEIAQKGRISENEDGSFSVPSLTSPSVYQVRILGDVWVCSCPDFENRANEIEMCKHAFAVKFWIAARVELEQKAKPKVFAEDATQCMKCGSIRVVRYGSDAGRQVFKCRDCGRKFRANPIKNARYTPETITLTLDLYFSGLSTRKISRMISDHFQTEIDQSTIYRWIDRFVPKISEYVNTLTPTLSETWHADEVFVKMKGGERAKGGMNRTWADGMAYLWNVMDRKTRFLLASKVTANRSIVAAASVMREAAQNAHVSRPEQILTDAHKSYRDGIEIAFGADRPKHIARMGVGKPHANNNRVERLNGTVRERVKVQRGWKSLNTKIAEGQRIQYNFVKPHMALDGQTPAQAAGLQVKGWKELLAEAITRDATQEANTP